MPTPLARLLRNVVWISILCAGIACSGRLRLPASEGHVIDHDSGTGVAGAHVIEWYEAGSLTGADVKNVLHSRATQCDDTGHFVFPAGLAPVPGLWLRKSYGPSYSVYHPDYGLQHARAGSELHVDRSRADVARDDLAALCRRGGDDPGTRRLIEVACPKLTPSRN